MVEDCALIYCTRLSFVGEVLSCHFEWISCFILLCECIQNESLNVVSSICSMKCFKTEYTTHLPHEPGVWERDEYTKRCKKIP